jgi:hypothetical protein
MTTKEQKLAEISPDYHRANLLRIEYLEDLVAIATTLDTVGVPERDEHGPIDVVARVRLLVDQNRRQAEEICRLRGVSGWDILGEKVAAQFAKHDKVVDSVRALMELREHVVRAPSLHLTDYPLGCDDLGCTVCAENIVGRGGQVRAGLGGAWPGEISPAYHRHYNADGTVTEDTLERMIHGQLTPDGDELMNVGKKP